MSFETAKTLGIIALGLIEQSRGEAVVPGSAPWPRYAPIGHSFNIRRLENHLIGE